MDNALLVDELKKVVTAVRRGKGHIALFMLTGSDTETAQTWNLVVSATGYDQVPIKDAVAHLINLVREHVSEEHLRLLTRATILKTADPFVKAMNQTYSIRSSTARLQSATIFGILIENAILFECQNLPEKSSDEKPKKLARKTKV